MIQNNPNNPFVEKPGVSIEHPRPEHRSIGKTLSHLFHKIVNRLNRSSTEIPRGWQFRGEQFPSFPTEKMTLALKFEAQLENPHVKERFLSGMRGDINCLMSLLKDFQEGNPELGIPQNLEFAKPLEELIQSKFIILVNNPNLKERFLRGMQGDIELLKGLQKDFQEGNPGYGIEKDPELANLLNAYIESHEPKKSEVAPDPLILAEAKGYKAVIELGKEYLKSSPPDQEKANDCFLKAEKMFMDQYPSTARSRKPLPLRFNPEKREIAVELIEKYNAKHGTRFPVDFSMTQDLQQELQKLMRLQDSISADEGFTSERMGEIQEIFACLGVPERIKIPYDPAVDVDFQDQTTFFHMIGIEKPLCKEDHYVWDQVGKITVERENLPYIAKMLSVLSGVESLTIHFDCTPTQEVFDALSNLPNLRQLTVSSNIPLTLPDNLSEKCNALPQTEKIVREGEKHYLDGPMGKINFGTFITNFKKLLERNFDKSKFIAVFRGMKSMSILHTLNAITPSQLREHNINPLAAFGRLVLTKVGHVFTLNNEVLVTDGKEALKTTGAFTTDMYAQAVCSVDDFFESDFGSETLSREDQSWVKEGLLDGLKNMPDHATKADAARLHQRYMEGKPLVIPTGWRGHALNVVIQGDLLIITNRGQRREGEAGVEGPNMRIFTIKDPSKIDEAAIMKLLDNSNKDLVKERLAFFGQGIIDELGLEPLHEIEKSEQKVGNCTYANNKAAFQALLFIQEYRKHGDIAKAESASSTVYERWSMYDRFNTVHELSRFLELTPIESFNKDSINELVADMTKKLDKRLRVMFNRYPELKTDPEFQQMVKEAYKKIAAIKKQIRDYQPL